MKRYRVFIAGDVFSYLDTLKKKDRSPLMDAILDLGRDPGSKSQATTNDQVNRILDIFIHRDHAIEYWIDHADEHIKVTSVSLRR